MAIKTFSVGEVLTTADTNTYLANAGLVLITSGITVSSTGGTAATVSNGTVTVGSGNTSVTVSNAFSATYDSYKIQVVGGTATANANMKFQLSGITTNVYYAGVVSADVAGGGYIGASDNATTQWNYVGWAGPTLNVMDMDLYNPFASTRKWYRSAPQVVISGSFGFGSAVGECSGTASASGFTISTGSGSFNSGSIRVYGYRKA